MAVVTFGKIIEGCLYETHNVGTEKEPKYESKYKLSQLLEPEFRLPVPKKESVKDKLRMMARYGVKVVKAKD